jgi:hypothetical protein
MYALRRRTFQTYYEGKKVTKKFGLKFYIRLWKSSTKLPSIEPKKGFWPLKVHTSSGLKASCSLYLPPAMNGDKH